MKVLFITTEFPGVNSYGGIGVFLQNINLGLRRRDIESYILVFSNKLPLDKVELERKGIIVKLVGNKKGRMKILFQKMYQLYTILKVVSKLRPDVVEMSTSDSYYLIPVPIKGLIARTHGSFLYSFGIKSKILKLSLARGLQKMHEKNLLRMSNRILAVSEKYKKFFELYWRNKTVLIENFAGPEYSNLCDIGSDIEGAYIFYHGTIKESKGCTDLVSGYLNSKAVNSHKLVLAGKGDERYVKNLVNCNSQRIIWVGECGASKLMRLIRNSSLCVYPSYRDAFNLAVAEALSQKALVLVSDVIDGKLVSDGVTGYSFPIKKIGNLAHYIDNILNMETCRKVEVRDKGYIHFQKNYSFQVGIENNIEFYKQFLELP